MNDKETLNELVKTFMYHHFLNDGDIKRLHDIDSSNRDLLEKNVAEQYDNLMTKICGLGSDGNFNHLGRIVRLYTQRKYVLGNPLCPMLPQFVYGGLSILDVDANIVYLFPQTQLIEMVVKLTKMGYDYQDKQEKDGYLLFIKK